MKCKYCGSRKFRITIGAYKDIEYDEKDQIVYSEVVDYGNIIEERGYYCKGCDRDLKKGELIREVELKQCRKKESR